MKKPMIYHSKLFWYHDGVRITVAGRFHKENHELTIAIARCSKRDTFRKKSIVIPAREEFHVMNSKTNKPAIHPENGKVIILLAQKEKILYGGVDLATNRLNENKVFAKFTMISCSMFQFSQIAESVCDMIAMYPVFVEGSKL